MPRQYPERNRAGRPVPLLAGWAAVALLATACSAAGSPGGTGHSADQQPANRPVARGSRAAAGPLALQVMPAPFQLPAGVSGAVGLARGGDVMIAGGSTSAQPATRAVTVLDPVSGRSWPAGDLAAPVTGSAGVLLAGQPLFFGGTARTSAPAVQVAPTAQTMPRQWPLQALPSAQSGLAAVAVAGSAYLLGGCGAGRFSADVLATRDGRHFRTAARLPVPVCAAGAAAIGSRIWLLGGRTAAGITDVIQQVDLTTGAARVVGRLPYRLAGAAAFVLDGAIYLAGGSTAAAGAGPLSAGLAPAGPASAAVLRYEPGHSQLTVAGQLPVPVADAAAAVVHGVGYLLGGADGRKPIPEVTTLRLVRRPAGLAPAVAPWLSPAHGPGHLAPGSQPAALPADVLIADHLNNRLVIIDPQGRIRWAFPRRGDLRPGQSFQVPDDAFFSPDGRYIVATQEDDQVISVISVAAHKIIYRYGAPGRPGRGPDRVDNPDDAMLLPGGDILSPDIKNCRILIIKPPGHRPLKIIGASSDGCLHDPPRRFGSPNGAFPLTDGRYLVTEINGDWTDEMSLTGHVYWSANPPGVAYPSDTNEVCPGRYLTVDYSGAGQIVEFNQAGRTLWRMGGLNHPSLALPLPNGNILVNDDFNDRVIVVSPASHRIIWQYGHTGRPSVRPGYLDDPDGVDLVPPDSLLMTHAGTMGDP